MARGADYTFGGKSGARRGRKKTAPIIKESVFGLGKVPPNSNAWCMPAAFALLMDRTLTSRYLKKGRSGDVRHGLVFRSLCRTRDHSPLEIRDRHAVSGQGEGRCPTGRQTENIALNRLDN